MNELPLAAPLRDEACRSSAPQPRQRPARPPSLPSRTGRWSARAGGGAPSACWRAAFVVRHDPHPSQFDAALRHNESAEIGNVKLASARSSSSAASSGRRAIATLRAPAAVNGSATCGDRHSCLRGASLAQAARRLLRRRRILGAAARKMQRRVKAALLDRREQLRRKSDRHIAVDHHGRGLDTPARERPFDVGRAILAGEIKMRERFRSRNAPQSDAPRHWHRSAASAPRESRRRVPPRRCVRRRHKAASFRSGASCAVGNTRNAFALVMMTPTSCRRAPPAPAAPASAVPASPRARAHATPWRCVRHRAAGG